MFFSEEKNQKTFNFLRLPSLPAMAGDYPQAADIKVFCFFSPEQKSLP